MHAHRVEVLDRADDDAVVRLVADDLHLVLLPAQHGFLDEDFGHRACLESDSGDGPQFGLVVGETGTDATHGEGGAHDHGIAELFCRAQHLVHGVADS